MSRLTDYKDYISDKAEYEKHISQGYQRNIARERFLKLAEYENLEEQGRLIKLPEKVEETEYRECVHTRTKCHHENYKCSECPLTELFCDEFYTAIDRCYEEAYASGCLAGMELGESEAKLKELRGTE